MKNEEGYIKFRYEWEKKDFNFPRDKYEQINAWREKLYQMNLIGMMDNGIGFGNISLRCDSSNKFIITGSATGKYKILNKMHYALVEEFSIKDNFIRCVGGTKASSESLTHAAAYLQAPSIKAIVHTHNKAMWEFYKDNKPTTSEEAPFGTPEIAHEIRELIMNQEVLKEKVIIMGGHEDGLITFGGDVDEAGEAMLEYYRQATQFETQ